MKPISTPSYKLANIIHQAKKEGSNSSVFLPTAQSLISSPQCLKLCSGGELGDLLKQSVRKLGEELQQEGGSRKALPRLTSRV